MGIVRTGKKPEVTYDSDNEEDNEQLQCVQYIQQQQKVLTGGKTSVSVNSNSGSRPTISYGEDRKKNLQKESGKLKSIEEEALQKHKDNEARRKREEEEAKRREREERERKKREEEEARRREKEERERKKR